MRGQDFYGPYNYKIDRLKRLGYRLIPISYELIDSQNMKGLTQIRKLLNKHCVMVNTRSGG